MDSKMELDTEIFKDGITINECSICYVNKVELSFLCKHSICKSCYHNVELCPFCRKRIKPEGQIKVRPIRPRSRVRHRVRVRSIVIIDDGPSHCCIFCIILFGPFIWLLFLISGFIHIY